MKYKVNFIFKEKKFSTVMLIVFFVYINCKNK